MVKGTTRVLRRGEVPLDGCSTMTRPRGVGGIRQGHNSLGDRVTMWGGRDDYHQIQALRTNCSPNTRENLNNGGECIWCLHRAVGQGQQPHGSGPNPAEPRETHTPPCERPCSDNNTTSPPRPSPALCSVEHLPHVPEACETPSYQDAPTTSHHDC